MDKASAKNSSKLNKFLHSEVNLLIQHIIVQYQDGQNNNKIIVMEHFNGILFHKFEPANKQLTNQSSIYWL